MSISFHALAHHHRHVSLTVDEPVGRSEKHDWQCDDGSGETDVDYLDGQYDGYMIGIEEDSDIDMDMDSQVREWEQERTRAYSDSTNSIMSTTSTTSYQSTSTALSASSAASSPKRGPHSAPFSPSSADQVQSPLSVSSTSSASTPSPSSPSPISHKPHNMLSPKSYLHSPAKSSPPPSVDGRSLSRRSDSRIIALHDKRVALNRKLYRARIAAGAGAGVGAGVGAAAAAGLAMPRRPRNRITLTVPHPTPNASPLPSSVSVSHTVSLNTVAPVFPSGTVLAAPAPALETPQPSQSLYHDTVSPVCRVDPSAECRHPDPAFNIYTYREIGRHVSLSSCWLVVRGRVYDITRFIPHHPAGNFSLLKHAGTDATEHFKMHSPEAQRLWETFQIGWLQGYREQAHTPQSSDKCTIM